MLTFHFISGLPRCGTTLLASLLRQNPAFYSHIESPTGTLFVQLLEAMAAKTETGFQIPDADCRRNVLAYMMHGYYSGIVDRDDQTIFDNNRKWAANADAIAKVFPTCQIFAMVRPVAEVVESLERQYADNPLSLSVMLGSRSNTTVYDRVQTYLKSDTGVVGWPLNALRSAFYGAEGRRVSFIEYHDLVTRTRDVLKYIHDKVGAAPHPYDTASIRQIPDVEWFDRKLGAPGLHVLQPQVKSQPASSILPPDLLHHLHSIKVPWVRR